MEASGTLDDQVGGSQVGNHQVKIYIQALLNYLGGNQNCLATPRAIFTKGIEHQFLPPLTLSIGIPGMEQLDLSLAEKSSFF
ncbi:MAG: hypothetical protein DDT25_00985 [Chloroflexi bacterium]|nr:hypothetical protein [Chloroflexota bacterium]